MILIKNYCILSILFYNQARLVWEGAILRERGGCLDSANGAVVRGFECWRIERKPLVILRKVGRASKSLAG